MIGTWVEIALAGIACVIALLRRASLLESRNGIPYTPRHAR